MNISATLHQLRRSLSISSGNTTTITVSRLRISFLEMEDVLFHHDSAVLMPARPEGASSGDGTEDDASDPDDQRIAERQNLLTGLKAIAATFKQFEFDDLLKIILAGHTDTSGQDQYNFQLSDLRARSVLYLIETGKKTEWAELCYGKHKVEDYQQILTYFNGRYPLWNCDPDGIDNSWGEKTERASDNFFQANGLGSDLIRQVKNDGARRWPVAAWEKVFDLYEQEIMRDLNLTTIDALDRLRATVKYLSPEKKYVACGESFPIDDAEKENYRSQLNRRVEILFFEDDNAPKPEDIDCPTRTTTKHTQAECPLWNREFITMVPVDPIDLVSTAYHLKFIYFDRVKQQVSAVPEGLQFKVYEFVGPALNEITNFRVRYSGDVYIFVIPDNPARQRLRFDIALPDRRWIFTENSDPATTPRIVPDPPVPLAPVASLAWAERIKYYDLPSEWSSMNYWTRENTVNTNGDRFEAYMVGHTIKPHGSSTTSRTAPLIFSFDDIVMVTANNNRRQTVTDLTGTGAAVAGGFNADSRYTLFYLDYTTMENFGGTQKNFRRLTIYNPDIAYGHFTAGPVRHNLIVDVPGNTRALCFCSRFYDVFDKRSVMANGGCDLSANQLLGARLAIPEDPDLHAWENISGATALHRSWGISYVDANFADNFTNNNPPANFGRIGNYELHYLHHCADLDNLPLSYLIVYWNCRYVREPHSLENASDPRPQATVDDVENHRRFGSVNAMNRSNRNYLSVNRDGAEQRLIRCRYYIEGKLPDNGGRERNRCNVVLNINPNGTQTGAYMQHDTSQLRRRDAHDDPNYFVNGAEPPAPPPLPPPPPVALPGDAGNAIQDVDGATYRVLTNHHEFGHASGCLDDYQYDLRVNGETYTGIPGFNQPYTAPGAPYSTDELARMNRNRAPRMRNLWKYVQWLNQRSGERLQPFLQGAHYILKWDFFNTAGAAQTIRMNFTPQRYQNTGRPAYQQINFPTGTGRMDLLLYKAGGETAHTLRNGRVFDGILVIRFAFQLDFSRGFWDWLTGTNWDLVRRRNWMQTKLLNSLNNNFNNRYFFSGPAGNDFQTTLVLVRPFFWIGANPPMIAPNFDINVNLSGSEFNPNAAHIDCGNNVAADTLVRYCIGKSTPQPYGPADLLAQAQWVGLQVAGNQNAFTVQPL